MFNPKPLMILFSSHVTPLSFRIALVLVVLAALFLIFIFASLTFSTNDEEDLREAPGISLLLLIMFFIFFLPAYFWSGSHFSDQAKNETISKYFSDTEVIEIHSYDNDMKSDAFFVETLDDVFYLTLIYSDGKY